MRPRRKVTTTLQIVVVLSRLSELFLSILAHMQQGFRGVGGLAEDILSA